MDSDTGTTIVALLREKHRDRIEAIKVLTAALGVVLIEFDKGDFEDNLNSVNGSLWAAYDDRRLHVAQ